MNSFLSTAGLARRSARRPWVVVIAWVLMLAVAGFAASQMQTALEGEMTNGAESAVASGLIEERLRSDAPVIETVIVRSDSVTIDSAAFHTHVDTVVNEITGLGEAVTSVMTYYDLQADGAPGAEAMVAEDKSGLLIQVEMGTDFEAATEHGGTLLETVSNLNHSGFEVMTVGDVSANEEILDIYAEDLGKSQVYGLPAALIVLVVVFGALIAAGVPIVAGLSAVVVAFGLASGISQFFELDYFVAMVIAMLGLAVGIDYSLFIIERYREERRNDVEQLDSITIAGATASKAVVFSGLTTAVALVALFLIPHTSFYSVAIGAVLAVATSVLAALTLTPAFLSILGDRINWPRRSKLTRATSIADQRRGVWARITRTVMRRPAISAILVTVTLLVISLPLLDLNTGDTTGIEMLPESDIKTAFEVLHDNFYVGLLAPVEIVIDGDAGDPAVMAATERLVESLAQNPTFGAASINVSDNNDLIVISAPMQSVAVSPDSSSAIETLRADLIPAAFADAAATIHVGGATATMDDFNSMLRSYMPLVFAFVLLLSFVVLTVAFRSIVIPFVSIFMNLLSVGAAYGMLVLAFQRGYGEFLGLTHTPVIEAALLVPLFCILFGLSMDYHFFLLSRIREHFNLSGDSDESVAAGLQSTGKIITGAALIMVVVFAAFATSRLATMQQFGFGLAISVLVDVTLVRSILLPSLMKMLGKHSWYLPAWLSRMPNVAIEGSRQQLPHTGSDASLLPAGGDD